MRVAAEGRERARVAQHARGDVGLQVQAGDDGHRQPDDGAQPLERLAFAVVDMFRDRRAVQVEVDGVKALALRVLEQRAGDALVGVARDMRRRRRRGVDRRQQRPAALLGVADEAAERLHGAAQPLDHRRAPRRLRIAGPDSKVAQSALVGAKVLVSCWKPAMRMRIQGPSISYRGARAGRGRGRIGSRPVLA
jgi:hypothetical protein